MSGIVIQELSPSNVDDFLSFFDHDAFSDNPEWDDCYCGYYHIQDKGRSSTSRSDRRREMANLLAQRKVNGFLAYDDARPVAWCNAAPRTNYPSLERVLKQPVDTSERVGSIVCFVVGPSYRGKGLASTLLNAACESFRKKGLEFAEAYPIKDSKSAADNFPGPLSMYTKAGFKPFREAESYVVVRKPLRLQ